MMAENNFPHQDPKETMKMAPGEEAKKEDITYQEEEHKEPMFGDKAREFEKENNIFRMSTQQIARVFVEAQNNGLDRIIVDEDLKNLVTKAEGDFNSWLMGHAYDMAKPGEIAGYLGLEVGKEISEILEKEGGQGRAKAEKIREKGYWSQFKEQVNL